MNEVIFNVLKNNYKLSVSRFENLIEFKGVIKNNCCCEFEIEGTVEFFDSNELSYSVNFYDIERDYEYDSFIGSFKNVNKDNIEELISIIVVPEFVAI